MTVTMDVVAWKLSERNPVFWSEDFRKFQLDGVLCYAAEMPLEADCIYGCTSEQWEALPERQRHDFHFLVVDTTELRMRQGNFPPSQLLLVDGESLVGLVNEITQFFSRLTRWDRQCHRDIIDGCGLQEMVGRLSSLIPYPALVFDPSFQVIAYTTEHTISIAGFETAVELGYTSPDRMETLKRKRILSRLNRTDRCILDRAASNYRQHNAYRKHCKEGRVVAYSCIFFGDFLPPSGFIDLIECFFENLDFYFAEAARLDRAGGYMYEYLVTNLIANRHASQDRQLLDRLRYIDLPLEASFFLIRLEVIQQEDVSLSYLCNLIRMSCPSTKPFLLEHAIFILHTAAGKQPNRVHVDRFISTLRLPLQKFEYICFVSNGFTVLSGIYDAAIQCGITRELAQKRINPDCRVIYYEDCWLFHCFMALERQLDLNSIYPVQYHRLVAYDADNGGKCLAMLQMFLRCNCDYRETAERLGVHRNTVAYRIQKICSEVQLDLDDFNTRLSLALAFCLQDYLGAETEG